MELIIKKYKNVMIAAIIVVIITSCNQSTKQEQAMTKNDKIFPKGEKITSNNFTGTAWLQMLVINDTTFNTSIGNVTFEPGARTKWHYHPGGQILLITNSKGLYQEKGSRLENFIKEM
jgi:hypothetical protein